MKMRKNGKGSFKKYGTTLRRGGSGGLSLDDISLRNSSSSMTGKPKRIKPPRVKFGSRAIKRPERCYETYRAAMSKDQREVEKALSQSDARYFRHLPKSKRKQLIRKAERRIEKTIGTPESQTVRLRMDVPTQQRAGNRKTDRRPAAYGEYYTYPDLRDNEAVDGMEQERMFFEGASMSELQCVEAKNGVSPMDTAQAFEARNTVPYSQKEAKALGGNGVTVATGDWRNKPLAFATNVPFVAHSRQRQGFEGLAEEYHGQDFPENEMSPQTLAERRYENRAVLNTERRRKEELKKQVARSRKKEKWRRHSKASYWIKNAGAGLIYNIRLASLSGAERERAEQRMRSFRTARKSLRATKQTARFTIRWTRRLIRFVIFAAPVLLPLFLIFLIIMLFSQNTRAQSEFLTGTAAQIYAALRAHDPEEMGDVQIASILGNMYAESGLSPDAIEGMVTDGGTWTAEDFPRIHYDGTSYKEADVNPYAYRGYGLLMWKGERANSLQARADAGVGEDAGEDRWNDLRVQIGFLIEEMENPAMWGTGEYTREDFFNAEDIDTAVRAFHSSYLMRGGTGPERLTMVEEIRIPKALEYYRKILAQSFEFAGNPGEMDMYGAMSVPWIRMDMGLFDPNTRTWSHSEEAGVLIGREGHKYGNTGQPVSAHGCGIVSAAMALSYCTGAMVYPSDIIKNPCFDYNKIGEYQQDCTENLAASFGVKVMGTYDQAEVTAAMKAGCPALILVQGMAPNNRVTKGHYFLLTGYDSSTGRYILTDPGGAGLGDPNCLTYVDESMLVSGRTYVPTMYGSLYRQTFPWEEITAYQAGPIYIFGVS